MPYPNVIFFTLLCVIYGKAAATQYIIDVSDANGTLLFTPEITNASSGDTVEFRFQSGNHSVVQSDFYTPCQPLAEGFDTGFFPVTPEDTQSGNVPVAEVEISNFTIPLYFYCAQANHCQNGMLASINSSPSAFEIYKAKAAEAPDNISSFSPSSTSSTASSTSSLQPTNTGSTSSSAPSTSGTFPASSNKIPASGVHASVVAGVVLGTAAIIVLAIGLWILWRRTDILHKRSSSPGSTFSGKPELDGRSVSMEGLKVSELEVVERPQELNGWQSSGRQERARRSIYELPAR